MEFKHLEKGKTYYKRVNNTYTEFVVEEVSYNEGSIIHNGDNIIVNEVYVREENGEFTRAESLSVYLTTQRNDVYVNYKGVVKYGRAELLTMPLTNDRHEDFLQSYWSFYDYDSGDQLPIAFAQEDIYVSYAQAKESVNTIVVNLDGSKEEIKGLVELVQLEDDQIKVIKEFKEVLKKMKEHNIVTLGYDVSSNIYFYNGRHVNVISEEYDVNADAERLSVYSESHISKHYADLGAIYVNDDSYYQTFFDRK